MMATTKNEENKNPDLISWVFSWSIPDIMNKTLLKDKVGQIPQTFSSTDHYLKSFICPLIEETHADLFSCLTTISRAPIWELFDIKVLKECKDSNDFLYLILFRGRKENGKDEGPCEPEFGDLLALTDMKPKCIDDLNRPKIPYTLVLIQRLIKEPSYCLVMSSKPIESRGKLYAVYLSNMTTNIRIWNALHSDQKVVNMNIIKNVLQIDPTAGEDCSVCSTGRVESACAEYSRMLINTFTDGLDYSQKSAVLRCIATKECHHQHTVGLIWGPPGTGKTRTVASLLAILLQMKCRTLTCAPTNIAVLGVINRLINLVRPTLKLDTYGLGDILLFGNGERMKIDDYEDLFDVFLDHRVSALADCLAPAHGWKGSAETMIQLLENPENLYQNYLNSQKEEDTDEEDEQEEGKSVKMETHGEQDKPEDVKNEGTKTTERKALFAKVIAEAVKENKKKFQQKKDSQKQKCSNKADKCKSNEAESSNSGIILWTFEEFFMKEFEKVGERLLFHLTSLYTHLPTCLIQEGLVKEMIRVIVMFQRLGTMLHRIAAAKEGLREAIYGFGAGKHFNEVQIIRTECIKVLNYLLTKIFLTEWIPWDFEIRNIRTFCLSSATLIFCTASSSAKLHTHAMTPLELLIVDEAAQLKECESNIPLQLPGLRHAILIGDEKQLPAMVQSKISEEADFGRSLFERLVILGHKKHLLNVQYRMHPSISLFPNKEFYGRQIEDGPNVRAQSYQKRFLDGKIYGSYSFIDITYGKEQFDDRHSRKNLVEAHVVAEIIANLHKKSISSKRKLRVGCISPYKAQVLAIQEKLGKTYSTDANNDFSVNIRSVDGFQGGEEDVIIISTVRCNGNGSVGFLSNHRRTNVVLTRARHCLWILGNSATLNNSGTIWKKLVLDSKARGCFYNATDDKNLVRAISTALVELRLFDGVLSINSLLFETASWKVCFSDEFMESIGKNLNLEVYKEAISVLEKLANGWRHAQRDKISREMSGICSLPLEVYEVKDGWKLVWTIDIQRENTVDIQVMKVWGILQASKIPDLTKDLDNIFRKYSLNTMSRCKYQHSEGNLVVPMKWEVESNWRGGNLAYDDPIARIMNLFGAMSLENQSRIKEIITSTRTDG